MAKKWKYQLNEEEVEQLEGAMRNDERVEVVQRATAIRQLHLGSPVQEVAQHFAVSQFTIYRWWQCWRAGGIEGLSNRPRPGRPPKADEAYWQQLEAVLEQEPRDLGYAFTIWTTARLRDHLEKDTGIRLSIEWLRLQMKERGYVYRRPKKDLAKRQNPQQRVQAEIWLQELKKERKTKISNSSLWTKAP